MYSSLALVALLGLSTSAVDEASPKWNSDYVAARNQGRKESKPVAVFVGKGKSGWNQLSKDGSLGEAAQKILAKDYVCVYVNAGEENGRTLSEAFEIKNGPGLVISDHSGKLQAFRHEGDLADAELTRQLRRFADPERAVSGTESLQVRRSYYYDSDSADASSEPASDSSFSSPAYSSPGRSC